MKINTYPNPWDLRYFQEIAATQNLSRASERLGIGQPALSLSLQRLEKILEVSLFYRRNKGLTLTPAGQRLLHESHQLLSHWDSVMAQTRKSQTELSGLFRLGCHPSVALYALPSPLRKIYENYPKLELQIHHGLSRHICERVISGELEFGIVVNPHPHPDLVIHKLASDTVCFWQNKKTLSDVLICDPSLLQTQQLLKKIKNKNAYKRFLHSQSLEVITALAKEGAGHAILPERVVKAFHTPLEKIEGRPTYQDEITFVYRADLIKAQSAKCIIDVFKSIRI